MCNGTQLKRDCVVYHVTGVSQVLALWPLSDPPSLILQLEWHSDTKCWSSTNPCREQWWQHIFNIYRAPPHHTCTVSLTNIQTFFQVWFPTVETCGGRSRSHKAGAAVVIIGWHIDLSMLRWGPFRAGDGSTMCRRLFVLLEACFALSVTRAEGNRRPIRWDGRGGKQHWPQTTPSSHLK